MTVVVVTCSLLIPSDDVLNLILHPNSNRDRERITFELRTDTVQQQRTIVRRMTTGRALPFGWQVDSATLGVCDFDQSGDATLLSDGAKKYQNAVNMRSVLAWTVHSACKRPIVVFTNSLFDSYE